MQQMHQGQIPGLPNPPPVNASFQKQDLPQNNLQHEQQAALPHSVTAAQASDTASSIDDLISAASKRADAIAPVQKEVTPAPPVTADVGEEKAPKKEKDKNKASKLVYSDNDVSPEEKMARLPRYAFTPEKHAAMA